MQQAPGPRAPIPDPDPGNRLGDFVKMKYHEAAVAALLLIEFKTASVEEIIRVILDNTRHIVPSPFANADSVEIAIVYAFWLTDSTVGDDTRSILNQKKNEVFTKAGVDSNENAKRLFDLVMGQDENTHPTKALGPILSKMKLLETISRIVDLVEHSQPGG